MVYRKKRAPARKGKAPFKKRPYRGRKSSVGVAAVKRIVNAQIAKTTETKKIDWDFWDAPVGQISDDLSGYFSYQVLPTITAAGTGSNQRIGNEISFTSAHYTFQILEQSSATTTDVQFQFMLVHDKSPSNNTYVTGNAANPVEDMFKNNLFIKTATYTQAQVRTFGSNRDPHNMNRFNILAAKKIYMKADMITNTSNRVRTFNMGLKLKKPIVMKWNSGGTYIPSSGGELFLLIFCDSGNCGSSVTSLTGGIPRGIANCGYTVSCNATSYYKDA